MGLAAMWNTHKQVKKIWEAISALIMIVILKELTINAEAWWSRRLREILAQQWREKKL